MKNFLFLLLIGGSFFLTSCEITREITIKSDGSGTILTTTDLSSLIGVAKMAGGGKEMDEMDDQKIDTVVSMEAFADSLTELSADERALVKKGKLGLVMNMEDEKFITRLEFPFTDASQLAKLDKLSGKVVQQAIKKQMAAGKGEEGEKEENSGMPSADDMPEGSIDDYFITTYSKGVIERKLDKEKYANVENDEAMKALQEMSAMGAGNTTLIFNLPSPAKKAEGKNVKLSEDKMKVTVISSTDDFFDNATDMEFRIEY